MKKRNLLKSKITNICGGIGGGGSIISAHNVCHNLCLAVVAILSIFGIAVSSDVLMFLEDYNLIFWSMGVFFLTLSLLLYFKHGSCMSRKMILANSGLLTIGVPFFQTYSILFWIVGGTIVLVSFGWFIKDKYFLDINRRIK